MRRLVRHRPSPAMIVAMIALFVAMSGASYAALAAKSVGPKQLKKSAVTRVKIKKNAVNGGKVQNGSLSGADLADGSLTGDDLGNDSVALEKLAPNSVNGAKVVDGSLGAGDVAAGTFLGGAITVQREDRPLPDNATVGIEVACPEGATILSGGSSVAASSSDDIHLTVSRPFRTTPGAEGGSIPVDGETFDAWRVVYRNPAGGTAETTARAFAICAQTP